MPFMCFNTFEDGYIGLFMFRIQRFSIVIRIFEEKDENEGDLHLSDEPDMDEGEDDIDKGILEGLVEDSHGMGIEGEGELLIEDIFIDKREEKVFDIGREFFSHAAQLAAFGAEVAVPATPQNIITAISWCLANQNFMQNEEGV